MNRFANYRQRAISVVFLLATVVNGCNGCSVLSHEALIDAAWDTHLKPLLLLRYPRATPADLKTAHAFAYGGSIIQDMGYYPHGSKEFSNLTHYVRTGDFVCALLSRSRDLNEFAFALGALSHHVSDSDVHRLATNPGEAMLYPKLQRKFGNIITYEESPAGHLKTEFGFDVLEVAKGNFAPQAYHDFIGFQVAKPLLMAAFSDTYGFPVTDLFTNFDRSVESYRRVVSKIIPAATRVAWAQRQDEVQRSEPGVTRSRFIFAMSRSSYERDWGKQYNRPSLGDHLLAVLLKLIPPIGPLRALQFKMPTPPVEALFVQSFDRSLRQYGAKLSPANTGLPSLENINYDTGEKSVRGVYRLADNSYDCWLKELASKNMQTVTPEIRANLLAYYRDLHAISPANERRGQWTGLLAAIEQLKVAPTASAGAIN